MASSPGSPSTTLNSDAWSWGWKTKFTVQNPPPKFLRAECEKLSRFALSHAASAPHLLTHLETEELAQRLRRIELVVENAGYLPTHVTRVAADKKLSGPSTSG